MSREDTDPEKDEELEALVEKYEMMKAQNRNIYLDPEQIIEIAEWYETNNNFDSVNEILRFGLKLHPEHPELLIASAYSHIDRDELREAEKLAELVDEGYSIEAKMLKAELLLMDNKTEEAERILNVLNEEEDPNLYMDIAGLYIDMNYIPKGLNWLQKAAELAPDNEDINWTIAECFYNLGKNEEAAYYYNKLIDKQPYSSEYWVGLAKAYFAQKLYDKTIEACDFALVSDSEMSDAHLFKGHSLFQLENYKESISEYEKVLAQNIAFPEYVYAYIGSCYNEMEEWETASLYYEKALLGNNELDTAKTIDVYINYSACFYKMKRFDEAHELCRTTQMLFPENMDSYLLEGRIYCDENKFEEAGKCWEIALDKNPEDVYVLARIGELCLEAGDLEKAKGVLEKAIELKPGNIMITMLLILTYIRLKDWKSLFRAHRRFDLPGGDDIKAFIQNYYEEEGEPLTPDALEDITKFEKEISESERQTENESEE